MSVYSAYMAHGDARTRVLEGLAGLLGPIIRVLLRAGVTWRDFSEFGKAKFVEIATQDFGIRGRPTNAARVAMLTGLDRREVARLRRPAASLEGPAAGFMSKPTQVLEAWFHDPLFCDSNGKPRELALDGAAQPSFTDLVRRYAPALPVVAMIKELKGANAIEETQDGRLRVLKRTYIPAEFSDNQVRLWSSDLEALGTVIEHNLTPHRREPARFHRRAINLRVDPGSVAAFNEFLATEGQAFLERVDDWLSAHETRDGNGVRLGVSVFHIQDRAKATQKRRGP